MKKVLVTGAGGFIGRNTLSLLAKRGYEVHAVTHGPHGLKRDGAKWHLADLFDYGEVKKLLKNVEPTHLLHFAWITEHGKYWTSPENTKWLGASMHLVDEFKKSGGIRCVASGTCAEYDWSAGNCSETTPLKPSTPYGERKKQLFEKLEGNFAWGRIFHLYGPGEDPQRLVPSVIRNLLQGEAAKCTSGTQMRDFSYVEDVADGFVTLLDSQVTGAVNIASGESISLKNVVQKIGQLIGREDLIKLGALETKPGDPLVLTADVKRLRTEVKWQPKFSLDVGLKKTIEWWKENENHN